MTVKKSEIEAACLAATKGFVDVRMTPHVVAKVKETLAKVLAENFKDDNIVQDITAEVRQKSLDPRALDITLIPLTDRGRSILREAYP